MTNITSEISPETIKTMVERVRTHLTEMHGVCNGLESYTPLHSELSGDGSFDVSEVFLLEREREFKFGNGKELIAITDGGKNKFGKPIKCVRYFNYYLGNNKCKPNDRTYTYSHEKASEMWKAKIGEGFKRVK